MGRYISECHRWLRRQPLSAKLLLALLASALVLGLLLSTTSLSQKVSKHMSHKYLYVSAVRKFWAPKNGKLGVSFYMHSMIVRVPRDHPKHDEWVALLRKSHEQKVQVEFAYSRSPGVVLAHLEEVPVGDERYDPDIAYLSGASDERPR